MTLLGAGAYRNSMVGRSHRGSRIVILLTVFASLLSIGLPPVPAFGCNSSSLLTARLDQPNAASDAPPASACTCSCCRNPTSSRGKLKACCLAKGTDEPAAPMSFADDECHCRLKSPPIAPDPSAPPRSADLESNKGLASGTASAAYVDTRPSVGPAHVNLNYCSLAPPPVDFVISLSRWTC